MTLREGPVCWHSILMGAESFAGHSRVTSSADEDAHTEMISLPTAVTRGKLNAMPF